MHREHFSRSEFIFMLVLFCYITQGAAGIADCDDARGDVARHDTARADHGIVPYRHAGQHRHARADPDVIADGIGRAISRPALRCSTSSGCPAAEKLQFGAMNTWSPKVMGAQSSITRL